MSTKTSIKRVALVAVSALGFGLLSVVPAKAEVIAGDVVKTENVTTVVGTASTASDIQISEDTGIADNATTVDIAISLAKPTGSSLLYSDADGAGAATTDIFVVGTTAFDAASDTSGTYTLTKNGVTSASTPDMLAGTVSLTPDIPGVYTVSVAARNLANNATIETETYTVLAASRNASSVGTATAALSASWGCTVVQAAEGCVNASGAYADPVLSVTMPTGAIAVSGTMKLKVTRTADSDLPVNSVIDVTAANVMTVSAGTSTTTFTPAVAGTGLLDTAGLYEFLAFEDTNYNGDWDSGERFVTTSIRLAGVPSTYSISLSPSSAARGDTVILDITMADANGYATASADTDDFVITAASLTGDKNLINSDALGSTGKRRSVMTVASDAADGANTISVTDEGSIFTSAVVKTATLTVTVPGNANKLSYTAAAGIKPGAAADVELENTSGGKAGSISVDLAKTTVYFTATAVTAGDRVKVTTTAAANTPTNTVSTSGVRYYTSLSDGTITFPVTITGPIAGRGYTIEVEGGTHDPIYTVTYADPGATWTRLPGSSINLVKGGSQKFTTVLKDVFDRPLASKAVTASVSGRNTATFSGITDANGVFEFTVTDTDTRACCSTTTDVYQDTVTLTYNYTNVAGDAAAATSNTITITYVATAVAASEIVITKSAASGTIDQIEAVAGEPASSAKVTYTATVRDSNGAAVAAGTICTWTADADTKFYLGANTGATSSGACSVTVYRQKAGYAVLTVSVGGATKSDSTILWSNDGDAIDSAGNGTPVSHDGRNVTVSAAQSTVAGSAATVTATVTDRWGNPVSGVLVTWSLSGVGRLVTNGDLTVGTATNGQAQVQVTSLSNETGTLNVTATVAGGQTANLAGDVSGTTVADVAAGNRTATSTVTFTADTSTSTADALLELAKAIGTGKEVEAATDAAAEAIDAANAATDAANLAAEAADAATVAAEEARDAADAATAAVEELATQVASLMSALKAQLTTLANTVAKIAKKVKA